MSDVKEDEIIVKEADEKVEEKEDVVETPEMVEDPGQLEGETPAEKDRREEDKKDKEHFPPEGSKRWKKIYGEHQEMQRTIADIREGGTSKDPAFIQLVEDNKKLLTAMRDNTEAVKATKEPEDTRGSEVAAIQTKIDAKKSERKTARDTYDNDRADAITDEIHELQIQASRIADAPKKESAPEVSHDTRDAVEAFTKASPWYNPNDKLFDEVMAGAAEALDTRLRGMQEWSNRPIPERLAEVQHRIEEKFQWYLEGEEPDWLDKEEKEVEDEKPNTRNMKRAAVESGGKSKPKDVPGTVTLSKEQLYVADQMGFSPQQYAKSVAVIEGERR